MVIASTPAIMFTVAACMLPGLLVETVLFGPRVLGNVVLALFVAAATEAVCLRLGGHFDRARLVDGSAVVTALILSAALPPDISWPLLAAAVAAAIGLGKYAYGGLGSNVFNPAMVGYTVILLSFPAALAVWPGSADGLTGATPLTTFKYREGATIADVWLPENGFGALGAASWEWVSLAFLGGGLIMFALKLAAWRVTAGTLGSLSVLALLCYDSGSSASLGSPFYHWFSGGTMLAAFFVVTDPVTHPVNHRGQWLFGLLAGSMIFLVRAFGNYPDGIAFAVLLANAVTPYLNRTLTSRRTADG